jgi:hypothetical protein
VTTTDYDFKIGAPVLKEQADALKVQWQAEKDAVQRLRSIRE